MLPIHNNIIDVATMISAPPTAQRTAQIGGRDTWFPDQKRALPIACLLSRLLLGVTALMLVMFLLGQH